MATKRATPRIKKKPAVDRLEFVCTRIAEGAYMVTIAGELGITSGALTLWVQADPKRSVRVRDLRASMAIIHEESAEAGLIAATDAFELAQAKELAHHKRWRASKIAPRDYGEKPAAESDGTENTVIIHGGLPD